LDADYADRKPETARIHTTTNSKTKRFVNGNGNCNSWSFALPLQFTKPSQVPYPCRFRFHPRNRRSRRLTLLLLVPLGGSAASAAICGFVAPLHSPIQTQLTQ
jgi:hypothetical protein